MTTALNVLVAGLIIYGLPLLGLIILIIIGKKYFDKRYKQYDNPLDAIGVNGDFVPTKEIFIDPRDGFKYQVYYNPKSGERKYVRVNQ